LQGEGFEKQVKEMGDSVAVTGNLVSQLGEIGKGFDENLKRMREETEVRRDLGNSVKKQADKAGDLLKMLRALNRQLENDHESNSGESSTSTESE